MFFLYILCMIHFLHNVKDLQPSVMQLSLIVRAVCSMLCLAAARSLFLAFTQTITISSNGRNPAAPVARWKPSVKFLLSFTGKLQDELGKYRFLCRLTVLSRETDLNDQSAPKVNHLEITPLSNIPTIFGENPSMRYWFILYIHADRGEDNARLLSLKK